MKEETKHRVCCNFLDYYIKTSEDFLAWASDHTELTDFEIESLSLKIIEAMKKGVDDYFGKGQK